jgi:hypothetical protein
MKKMLAPFVAAVALLFVFCLPQQALAQNAPPTINTAGLTCTKGVCDLGSRHVGTFLNVPITSSGGSGPTPYTWKVATDQLPASLTMARYYGMYSTQITGTPTEVETRTFTVQVRHGATGVQTYDRPATSIDDHLGLVLSSRNSRGGLSHELFSRSQW